MVIFIVNQSMTKNNIISTNFVTFIFQYVGIFFVLAYFIYSQDYNLCCNIRYDTNLPIEWIGLGPAKM
jgi:hypothetical protein